MNIKIFSNLIILSAVLNVFLDLGTQALAIEPDQKVNEPKVIEPSFANPLKPQSDRIPNYIAAPTQPLAQITAVSQLSDVKTTDWAFTAL
jgi:hypothetical protein